MALLRERSNGRQIGTSMSASMPTPSLATRSTVSARLCGVCCDSLTFLCDSSGRLLEDVSCGVSAILNLTAAVDMSVYIAS